MTRYYSLRYKLAALIAAGGLFTAVIAAAGFTWLDFNRFQQSSNAQVSAIATVVADQVAPAITLCAGRLIREASLYDEYGRCFSAGRSSVECPPLPPDGLRRRNDTLMLTRPILLEGERRGTLVLGIQIPTVPQVVRQYAGGAVLIVVLSLVIAGCLALALQSRVSRPILEVAAVAQRIARTHSFTDRVQRVARDELGILADSFNSMLDEIQRRDSTLERQRLSLQTEINDRIAINAELRAAMEKAEEATRLKSEFLANMSHEIRTPMNGVLGMISLVLEQSIQLDVRKQLEAAETAGRSLITILNDILDLSKLEAGKMTLEAIDFDLIALVNESLRGFEFAARQKGISLSVGIEDSLSRWVRGDPGRLRQVLLNLAGNAVKFTLEGVVRISVSGAPGSIRFEVADTGIGIDPSKQSSIFDAFTQADGSHSRQFGGTGLGLTITRRLVHLMGGRLWVESAVGQGSRFYVDLPLSAAARQTASPPAPVASGHDVIPSGLRILVAEDNPINQRVVCAMLERRSCKTVVAVNGEEACRRFLSQPFDLILMDVQMPEVDGLEATRQIRIEEARQGLPRMPILALTAHASRQQHEQCMASGMDAVLTKPVNLPELLRRIAELVSCPSRA